MIKILTLCPVCDGQLKAVKLKCDTCGTLIENSFDFPSLLRLSKDQMAFIEVFIMNRGNIKDVEKELGISYPTVRAKLDQVIDVLQEGGQPRRQSVRQGFDNKLKDDILKQLEEGTLSPDEAILQLEKHKKGGFK